MDEKELVEREDLVDSILWGIFAKEIQAMGNLEASLNQASTDALRRISAGCKSPKPRARRCRA